MCEAPQKKRWCSGKLGDRRCSTANVVVCVTWRSRKGGGPVGLLGFAAYKFSSTSTSSTRNRSTQAHVQVLHIVVHKHKHNIYTSTSTNKSTDTSTSTNTTLESTAPALCPLPGRKILPRFAISGIRCRTTFIFHPFMILSIWQRSITLAA